MDLQSQEAILRLSEQHGKDQILVVLGSPDEESAEIAAETVVLGDPSYAGPLAGAQLGLDVFHILEADLRGDIPDDVWEDQIGVMADVLDADAISAAVAGMRAQASAAGSGDEASAAGSGDEASAAGSGDEASAAGSG